MPDGVRVNRRKRAWSNPDLLDLVEVDLVAGAVVELGGLGRFVVGDGLGVFAGADQYYLLCRQLPRLWKLRFSAAHAYSGGRYDQPRVEHSVLSPASIPAHQGVSAESTDRDCFDISSLLSLALWEARQGS